MASDREPAVVRYHPAVGSTVLVLGGLNTVLGILALLRGDLIVSLVLGALFLLLGTLLLTRPYFRVGPGEVEVVGMIGVGTTTYPYRRLEITGGRLTAVRADRSRQRIPVQRWFARRADWEAVVEEFDVGPGGSTA